MISQYLDLRINQELDSQLTPCPTCHHEYNDPHAGRKGPTCIDCFEGDEVHIKCLNCWTKSRAAKTQTAAMKLWNAGKVKVKEIPKDVSPLRMARDKMRMTQKEFAAYLDIPLTTYKNYECGGNKPGPENSRKIYNKLGISPKNVNKYLWQRTLLGRTQLEIGKAAGVDRRAVMYLEHGKSVNPSQLERIEKALGMI